MQVRLGGCRSPVMYQIFYFYVQGTLVPNPVQVTVLIATLIRVPEGTSAETGLAGPRETGAPAEGICLVLMPPHPVKISGSQTLVVR